MQCRDGVVVRIKQRTETRIQKQTNTASADTTETSRGFLLPLKGQVHFDETFMMPSLPGAPAPLVY